MSASQNDTNLSMDPTEFLQEEALQILTFDLGSEIYAADISCIREVLELKAVSRVPQTPDFLSGVINLRGSVVPVIDMQLKLETGQALKTVDSCIVVLEVSVDGEDTVIGIIVDSVSEVLEVPLSQIKPAPKMGSKVRTDFIHGITRIGDDFAIILAIEKIFTMDELTDITSYEDSEVETENIETARDG